MADGVKEVRFWKGWPEGNYNSCESTPKILFNGSQIAMTDDSAVDPDASPPTGEGCCCCAECDWCDTNSGRGTKKPSMVAISFSGIATNGNCNSTERDWYNNSLFELKCERTGTGDQGGGKCCYNIGFSLHCAWTSILYCLYANHGDGTASPYVKLTYLSYADDWVEFYDADKPESDYDIDCTAVVNYLDNIIDDTDDAYFDWSGASVVVIPYDCHDAGA